jgi:uncharacterized membrane protein
VKDTINNALITNDATVLGLLFLVLGFIYFTSHSENSTFKKFYKFCPALLLCYFLPGILNTADVINGEHSKLYFVASRYLLPACLVLLTLNIDIQGIKNLGPKAVIMFFTGTFGIVIGGPIALFITLKFFPSIFESVGIDQAWRGMSTIAGSWIGGGANQAAMKEVFSANDLIFSMMVVVDVLVASAWMAVLLFMADKKDVIDLKNNADNSSITDLQKKLESYQEANKQYTTHYHLMIICSLAFGATGLAHLGADIFVPFIKENMPFLSKFSLTSKFFWVIVLATTFGLIASFTRLRKLEGVGASKVGSVFLYVLVASIGMKMNIIEIFKNPGLFFVGGIWMVIHATLMLIVAKIIRAPIFFMAVASQANVGGAASAPVVASAFHPSLAPVGVLLAVLGYAVGTYAAWICGQLMSWVTTVV